MLSSTRMRCSAVLLATLLGGLLCGQSAAAPSSEAAQAAVLAGLDDSCLEVRVQAAAAAGTRGVQAARPGLRRLLDDSSPAVQAAAAVSLARLGDDDARGALTKLLKAPKRLVVQAAEKGLVILDEDLASPRVLVTIGPPSLPAGVEPAKGNRFSAALRRAVGKMSGVVVATGEEHTFSGKRLKEHLRRRRLRGVKIMPAIVALGPVTEGDEHLISCEVSVATHALVHQRLDFSGTAKAAIPVGEGPLSPRRRDGLENTLIDASAQAALDDVLQHWKETGP